MIFYDFEVFRYDWLVVLIDLNARKETVIINDPDKLKRFYEEHKGVIWAGYNSRNYDQYILKAILCGFDEVYTAVLKNADGDTLEVEGDECDFKAMAVAIEIAGTTVERR